MKYEEMSDFEINRKVATVLGIEMGVVQSSNNKFGTVNLLNGRIFNPCNNPSDAWPIMIDNNIFIAPTRDDFEHKYMTKCLVDGSIGLAWTSKFTAYNDNPLRAAMICFLLKRKGEEKSA